MDQEHFIYSSLDKEMYIFYVTTAKTEHFTLDATT